MYQTITNEAHVLCHEYVCNSAKRKNKKKNVGSYFSSYTETCLQISMSIDLIIQESKMLY